MSLPVDGWVIFHGWRLRLLHYGYCADAVEEFSSGLGSEATSGNTK